MRPVNRGLIPKNEDGTDKVYTSYKQAKDDLKKALGTYCSYCEMGIENQVDIEHVIPKSHAPSLENDWNNFLLACKSCNIIKSDNNVSRDGYVFPDIENTSFLFEYSEKDVKVKDDLPENIKVLATSTFDLVKLNRKVDTSNMIDDRAYSRLNSWNKAQEALKDFLELLPISTTPEKKYALVNLTANTCNGFFSMWIQIFQNYPEVKKAILENVNGTAMGCYDENYNPKEELLR